MPTTMSGESLPAQMESLAAPWTFQSCKGCGAVEKILSVVKIEDREAAIGLLVVSGREIDDKVALIAEKARTEIIVFAKLAVVHGTICTSRSLASTCCPCVTRSFATFPEIVA